MSADKLILYYWIITREWGNAKTSYNIENHIQWYLRVLGKRELSQKHELFRKANSKFKYVLIYRILLLTDLIWFNFIHNVV